MHEAEIVRLSLNLICKATQTGHKAKLYDTRGDVLYRFFHNHPDAQSDLSQPSVIVNTGSLFPSPSLC